MQSLFVDFLQQLLLLPLLHFLLLLLLFGQLLYFGCLLALDSLDFDLVALVLESLHFLKH